MNFDEDDAKFYINSGATAHMINNLAKILELKSYKGIDAILLSNKDCLHILHVGKTSLALVILI